MSKIFNFTQRTQEHAEKKKFLEINREHPYVLVNRRLFRSVETGKRINLQQKLKNTDLKAL